MNGHQSTQSARAALLLLHQPARPPRPPRAPLLCPLIARWRAAGLAVQAISGIAQLAPRPTVPGPRPCPRPGRATRALSFKSLAARPTTTPPWHWHSRCECGAGARARPVRLLAPHQRSRSRQSKTSFSQGQLPAGLGGGHRTFRRGPPHDRGPGLLGGVGSEIDLSEGRQSILSTRCDARPAPAAPGATLRPASPSRDRPGGQTIDRQCPIMASRSPAWSRLARLEALA